MARKEAPASNEWLPATKELCSYTDPHTVQNMAERLGLAIPLHLLTVSRAQYGRRACAKMHLDESCLGYPCVVMLEPDVAVVVPELAFMQTTVDRSPIGNLLLAFELCGQYDGAAPLMSPVSLEALVQCRGRKSGTEDTRDVLEFLRPGSKSHVETVLLLLIMMISAACGVRLPAGELNVPVTINSAQRHVFKRDFLMPDIVWREQRLVVEYDSRQWHSDYARRESDTLKGNAFQDSGYDYICITKSQIENPGVFFVQLKAIARALGHALPERLTQRRLAEFYRLRMELSPDWLGRADALARRIDFPRGLP